MPIIGIWRLLQEENSFFGIRTGNLARLDFYFVIAVLFDVVRNLGFAWASIGIVACIYGIFSAMGIHAATMYFFPEARSLKESFSKLSSRLSFLIYEAIIAGWLILYLTLPSYLVPSTLVMLSTVIAYPTTMFLFTKRRAKPVHIKKIMNLLSISWSVFVTLATVLFALGTQPPVLGFSISYSWEIALLAGSGIVFIISTLVGAPIGSTKVWVDQLIPQTSIRTGHRYLVLHDSGRRTLSWISATLRTLIESGARIIVLPSSMGWLRMNLSENEPYYNEWTKNGKILFTDSPEAPVSLREGLTERLSFAPTSTIYIHEIAPEQLNGTIPPQEQEGRTRESTAEVFLLDDANALQPQVTAFLHQNNDIEFLNLSKTNDAFSANINLTRDKIRGCTILLEYDTNTGFEGIVDNYLLEGLNNAELSVLFTSKSSKLYRYIKGKRLVKIIAASTLLSVPEELSDGEVEIPDRELGLVTSIVSDYVENSKGMGAAFVFDSITDLIRGERWEAVFSGIKQLNELLNSPNVTALYLANHNTMDPRFLGALRAEFQIQLRLDSNGLRRIKPAD